MACLSTMSYESKSARILRENMSGETVWSPDRGWHDVSSARMGGLVGYEYEHVARDAARLTADAYYYASGIGKWLNWIDQPWSLPGTPWRKLVSNYWTIANDAIEYFTYPPREDY